MLVLLGEIVWGLHISWGATFSAIPVQPGSYMSVTLRNIDHAEEALLSFCVHVLLTSTCGSSVFVKESTYILQVS